MLIKIELFIDRDRKLRTLLYCKKECIYKDNNILIINID